MPVTRSQDKVKPSSISPREEAARLSSRRKGKGVAVDTVLKTTWCGTQPGYTHPYRKHAPFVPAPRSWLYHFGYLMPDSDIITFSKTWKVNYTPKEKCGLTEFTFILMAMSQMLLGHRRVSICRVYVSDWHKKHIPEAKDLPLDSKVFILSIFSTYDNHFDVPKPTNTELKKLRYLLGRAPCWWESTESG
ncbi:hypothetical protein EIP91_004876 [Steccherinum ochraceum]|uniref:PiggyBac transposable element-derived protein domain-containing protein n=1 Tax=Steccherinum ochraceum TaxID=92696 RepID=A0A4R0R8R2_9APHY|nr:hypothetical protein EIP91_004876 [Steccherinum ochraceum]